MPYRLDCKNYFLTYPQCPISKEVAKGQLSAKLADAEISYICVAEEAHEDGSPHLHAFIQCEKKKNIRDPAFLDLIHPENGTRYHGNYQAAKRPLNSIQYVKKDGNFIREGTTPVKNKRSGPKDTDLPFQQALAASTAQEAEEILAADAARDFIINHKQITSFLENKFHKPAEYVPQYTEFPHLPGSLLAWREESLGVSLSDLEVYSFHPSLYLPTNLGKSARSS